MSILDNIGKNLDKDFENHNYLPQGIFLEDIDVAIVDYIKNLNLTVEDETGNQKTVPVIFLAQELWAEKKMNWKDFRFEYGEELSRPFIAIARKTVKPGTSPLKRTIPIKRQFKFVKVPTFDGTLKGYSLYKIPQPTWVDVEYDMILAAYYMVDVNAYYEKVLRDGYSNGQGYLNINGHHIASKISDPSQTLQEELASEKLYQVTIPIIVHGKLLDPSSFEKVNTINKISIKISEQKSRK
jgi:hypothetical protein